MIPIIGFDEFMVELGMRLIPDFDLATIDQRIEDLGKKRAQRYRDEAEKVRERIEKAKGSQGQDLQPVRRAFESAGERPTNWWGWELRARAESDPGKREAIYREGIENSPKSAGLIGSYANFMKNIRKDNDEVEQLYRKALELDPTDDANTGDFANFMYEVRKDNDEAERLYRKALELDSTNAINTGNFANFMHEVRKVNDEAERLFREPLELDPTNAINTGVFAIYMHEVRRDHGEAERLFSQALELDPSNLTNTANFVEFLLIQKKWDDALTFAKSAWKLNRGEPNQLAAIISFFFALIAAAKCDSPVTALGLTKTLFLIGFTRCSWSFEVLFDTLSPIIGEDMQLFCAVADAILDEEKVAVLEELLSWQEVEPVPLDAAWLE